jgi:2'-5' RNA ligase
MNEKRMFFGLEVISPWPMDYPSGRLIKESDRHLTLAFLPHVSFSRLSSLLDSCPLPSFQVGLAGQFDQCLPLPTRHPTVVSWHVEWIENDESIRQFQQKLMQWLIHHDFHPSNPDRDFLPHVTLARQPFVTKDWIESFKKRPIIAKDLHLYESLGHSNYQSCWHYPIRAPFEEIDHTADIAFFIRGKDFEQLYQHALIALTFQYPPILDYLNQLEHYPCQNIEEVIMELNVMISKVDAAIGCPFKALSFHDLIIKEEPNLLKWEMIVDV